MATYDGADAQRDDADGGDNFTIEDAAAIIGGTMMSGASGDVGATTATPGQVGAPVGVTAAGMGSRDLTEEEAELAPEPDRAGSPDMYAGGGATEPPSALNDVDTTGSTPTLITAEDAADAEDGAG